MNLNQRILAFVKLGEIFKKASEEHFKEDEKYDYSEQVEKIRRLIETSVNSNQWFIEPFVRHSIRQIGESLSLKNIQNWLSLYDTKELENIESKRIAIIMAGNIPLVGFHDLLTVLISGNDAIIKESTKDPLMQKIIEIFISIEPEFAKKVRFEESILADFDAVIATGSNNTKRYFEYYFSKYPSIIRGHRNSVAVLTGNESEMDLKKLADDIFLYFGLGCRNVSKLYIPIGFPISRLMEAFEVYRPILENHSKYFNNYEYNKSIYLVNRQSFFDSGFVMLKKDENMVSPISVIYFEEYTSVDSVRAIIHDLSSQIQCVVSQNPDISKIKLGFAQSPYLDDYADGVDVLKFCIEIKKRS